MGLIWTLICRYQIKSSGRGLSTKKALISWVNTVIPEYMVENFTHSWNDGRPVCGMVDHIRPGTCPNHFALDPRNGLENCILGMDLADQHLNIPKILEPEDLHNPDVDELSVMTYVSYFCNPFNEQLLAWIRKKIPKRNIQNLSSDWNDGVNLGALAEACYSGLCPDWDKLDPAQALDNLTRLLKLLKDRLGLEAIVTPAEMANPKVDEIVMATYLSKFRNAKLRASPEEFFLRVPSMENGAAIVKEPVSFTIDVTKEATELADEIKVKAHGPSSDINVSLKSKGAQLVATFVPTEAGSYEIFAVYQGDHIQGSPFSLPCADPSKCQIFGDIPSFLQVGEPQTIIVKTRGAGMGKLACSLTGSDALVSSSIEDKGEDTEEVKLEPKAIGEALVNLTWAGRSIPSCPFSVSVCDASKCSVTGDVLESGEGKVGEVVRFMINTMGAGSATPMVRPRGPSANYSPEVKDEGGDKYESSFTPWEVGPHLVEVMWGAGHVPGSPFSLNVTPAPDANTCSATGRGLKVAVAQVPTSFTILSPEKGLLEKPDGLEVKVSSMKSTAIVKTEDNSDGSYKVTYTAPEPGSYVVAIKFYEKHIPGSPFKLEVVPAPNAVMCKAHGPALHPNSLHIAGTPLDLYVDTQKAGSGELQVIVKGPNDSRPKVFMANDKGVHSIKFDVPDAGRYYIYIWWSQVLIPGAPFKIRVHPSPDAGQVKAYGPGLEEGMKVEDPGDFTIETKNAGIGTITIRVHGVKGGFKIEANPESETSPRTLLGNYTPTEPGDYIVAIRWSGKHVPGSPFRIHIFNPEPEKKKAHARDDEDEEGVEDGQVPPMSKEEMRRYQQHMYRQQRLVASGIQPMNPAYHASGGAHGMNRRMRTNPSMGVSTSSTAITSTESKKTKTKKTKSSASDIQLQEETSSAHVGDSPEKAKKPKKRQMKL